jgi:hypothetical protein
MARIKTKSKQNEAERLRKALNRLAKLLREVITDYEHCAVDDGGNLDPWRKRLIKRVRTAISKVEMAEF